MFVLWFLTHVVGKKVYMGPWVCKFWEKVKTSRIKGEFSGVSSGSANTPVGLNSSAHENARNTGCPLVDGLSYNSCGSSGSFPPFRPYVRVHFLPRYENSGKKILASFVPEWVSFSFVCFNLLFVRTIVIKVFKYK